MAICFRFHLKMTQDNYSISPELIKKVYDRASIILGKNLAEDFSQSVMLRSIEYLDKFKDKPVDKVVQQSFVFELLHRHSKNIKSPSIEEIRLYYDSLIRNSNNQDFQDLLLVTVNKMNGLELLIAKDLLGV